ncbi:hypothetical protein ANO14919_070560 [Xylariales sp. No.14919]|nr:hypothetical protein ANO14919_070560 [Xylariales sp. No.14919]
MAALAGDTGPSQPWYERRANARTISARRMLLLSSFIPITLSLASFLVVDATVPATPDMSLLNVRAAHISYNGANPVFKLGTFGYCVGWTPDESNTDVAPTQSPICFRGNGYSGTAVISRFFDSPDVPIGYIASLAPAASALHPLITVLVLLVLVTAALPCFIPPIVAVALSWLTAASSIAAVACVFSLALATRSRLVGRGAYVFEYGVGIWLLLVGAIGVWVLTILLTTAWWLRRRSDRRNTGDFAGELDPAHYTPGVDASVESQVGGLPGGAALQEIPGGNYAHRHELFNTDTREKGRVELEVEGRYYELDTTREIQLARMKSY